MSSAASQSLSWMRGTPNVTVNAPEVAAIEPTPSARVKLRCPALGCGEPATMDGESYDDASSTQVLTCPCCRLGHPTREWERV